MKAAPAAGFVACLMPRSMVAVPTPGGAATDGAGGETRGASAAGASGPVARNHAQADLPPRSASSHTRDIPARSNAAPGISRTISPIPGVTFHGTHYAGDKRLGPARGSLAWADDGSLTLRDLDTGTEWSLHGLGSCQGANIVSQNEAFGDRDAYHIYEEISESSGSSPSTISVEGLTLPSRRVSGHGFQIHGEDRNHGMLGAPRYESDFSGYTVASSSPPQRMSGHDLRLHRRNSMQEAYEDSLFRRRYQTDV